MQMARRNGGIIAIALIRFIARGYLSFSCENSTIRCTCGSRPLLLNCIRTVGLFTLLLTFHVLQAFLAIDHSVQRFMPVETDTTTFYHVARNCANDRLLCFLLDTFEYSLDCCKMFRQRSALSNRWKSICVRVQVEIAHWMLSNLR